MQSLAFEILSSDTTHPKAEVRLGLIQSMAKASGMEGMVGGQAMDISAETALKPLGIKEIVELQSLKTGALIKWSAEVGARLTNQVSHLLPRMQPQLDWLFKFKMIFLI